MSPAPDGASASDLERLRARFEHHARACCDGSPLYAEICRAVAGDAFTLELMLHAPEHQRRPTLLQAAIHDLLLAGAEHELAAHVPTVAAGHASTSAAGELALRFCREHADELARILATRTTQTNEVNRAAALLPALVHAVPPGRPVRLVEIGSSAGLNLLLDRFSYRYNDAAPIPGTIADAGGRALRCRGRTGEAAVASEPRVVCACRVCGRLPALGAPPAIAERIGVDLHPVDLEHPGTARWLLACVWPDQPDRIARLRAAIELARSDRPTVVRGDGRALLAELVGPRSDVHPVIWHSWVLAYWSELEQRALADAIDGLGRRRPQPRLGLPRAAERDSGAPDTRAPRCASRPERRRARRRQLSRRQANDRTARQRPPALHHMRWLAAS